MLNFAELSPEERVVVRYRVQSAAPGDAQFTDVIGYVREVGPREIEVQTRKGTVRVARALITHAKVVPPPPQRRSRRTPSP